MTTVISCLIMPFEVVFAFWVVAKIRILRGKAYLELPIPSSVIRKRDNDHNLRLAIWADRLILAMLFWKPGRCVYRSYAVGSILRRRGTPVTINFGLSHRRHTCGPHSQGHCWLMLDDIPFREKEDPRIRYSQKIISTGVSVQFWIDPNMSISST